MSTEPRTTLDTRFSSPDAAAPPWSEIRSVIEQAEIFWLSTVRRDGRPHVTPLPAVWLEDALHFCTGPGEQKAVNLAADPRCALTTGTNAFRSGLDVVVEGEAVRVLEHLRLARLAERWSVELGWRFDVVDGGFRDPGVGDSHVAHVFRVAPAKILAFGKGELFSQTRYAFP